MTLENITWAEWLEGSYVADGFFNILLCLKICCSEPLPYSLPLDRYCLHYASTTQLRDLCDVCLKEHLVSIFLKIQAIIRV